MKVKNTSERIIGVCGVVSLPDQVVEIPDLENENESILCLVSRGELKIVEAPKKQKAKAAVKEESDEAKEDAEEVKAEAPKKRTYTKKTAQ